MHKYLNFECFNKLYTVSLYASVPNSVRILIIHLFVYLLLTIDDKYDSILPMRLYYKMVLIQTWQRKHS